MLQRKQSPYALIPGANPPHLTDVNHSKLTIEQREKEGIIILDLEGHLTLGAEDQLFRQKLQDLRRERTQNVIVSLEHVSKLDTAGLGSLVFCALTFRESGGRLVVLHPESSHANLADVLRLDTELETYTDELSAINSFFPERAVPHYDLLEFVRHTSSISDGPARVGEGNDASATPRVNAGKK